MGSYLQSYGVEEARRGVILKRIIIAVSAFLVLALVAYLFFHNYPERRKVNGFLSALNSHDYQSAYREWGCTAASPCPNYDMSRFMADWSPKSATGPWSVASSDSCNTFLTVNVQAPGSELESLAVQRSDKSLGFAPYPDCHEPKWRWKQFFQRFLGKEPAPPKP